jgi:hypothetical protein
VYVYDLDSGRLHWRVPVAHSRTGQIEPLVTCMSFLPDIATCAQPLLVACSDNTFALYDTEARQLAEWSKVSPPASFPPALLTRPGAMDSVSLDPRRPGALTLRGRSTLVLVDLTRPMSAAPRIICHPHAGGKELTPAADSPAAAAPAESETAAAPIGKRKRAIAGAATQAPSPTPSSDSRDRGSESSSVTVIDKYKSVVMAAHCADLSGPSKLVLCCACK